MKMWEILERDGGDLARRGNMSRKDSNDALEEAYKCGYKEGYKEGKDDSMREMGHRYGQRSDYMPSQSYGERNMY